jgi:hypothetical protein
MLHFDQMQRYTYSPLPAQKSPADSPEHIRLLSIERHPEDNKLQGYIQIVKLSEKPRYEALSYVWGAENPKFPIGRHEPIFDVPKNLYTALHSIMSLTDAGERRTLWVDQICINQNDEVEKEGQVKLMGEIYESAHDVLVYLGDPPPGILNVATYLEQLPSIAKKIERNVVRIGPNFLPSVTAGLPRNDDPVWAILVDILHKDWYDRVWTLQEAVLAKRLVVYYGTNILDWDLVVKLYAVYGAAPLMPLRGLFDEKEMNYHSIKWIQTYRRRWEKGMGIEFTHLLWSCGFKKCFLTVDRIYGMRAMADESIRKTIVPNYHAPKRQVFLDAFKAAIQRDPQLHILSLPFNRKNELGLPTWCPNLVEPNGCVQLNSYLVGIKSPTEKSSIVAMTDSDFLRIQGLEVDKISWIASSQYPDFKVRDRETRESLLFQFHDETLRKTQEVYGTPIPEEYCRTLIADVARAHGGRKWSTEEMLAGYESHFAQGPLQAHVNANVKSLSSIYSSCAVQACAGRKFITTKEGRVGLAPANCQVDDVICVFLGACVPHVLRPKDAHAEATTFSFIGDCYVHGLMNTEALVMLEKDPSKRRDIVVT